MQMLPASPSAKPQVRSGFTIAELLVVTAIIAMLLALLLPSVRLSRGAARRTQCIMNMKQMGLAILNHESAHGTLPMAIGAFDEGIASESVDFRRHSGIVSLLPFMEQQDLWDAISNPTEFNGVTFPAMGPASNDEVYPHWKHAISTLLCPASPSPDNGFGLTNYAFCIGDTTTDIHREVSSRGAFGGRTPITIAEVTDGTSRTIAMAEIGTRSEQTFSAGSVAGQFGTNQPADLIANPAACRETLDPSSSRRYAKGTTLSKLGRGGNWADGSAGYTLFNTVLPPNSPSCAIGGTEAVDGIYSAGGFHETDGVNVVMLDGSASFIMADIDASDNTKPVSIDENREFTAESPYGIWGALGTVAGNDSHSDKD